MDTTITLSVIQEINKNLPIHSMWDGFWVHYYHKGHLTLSCSFNRIYYRDFDIDFKGVVFFNLPSEWRDTDIWGDDLIRLSDREEFKKYHQDFDTGNHTIMAIDIYFQKGSIHQKYTFFVVALSVELQRVQQSISSASSYVDLYEEEQFPCFRNRVE
ncbi:MAG: hypothetical protein KDD32_10045 [Bacteroidetes bacterium]|nr:hypothetical protein [Bacteroidota bacterium]